MRISIYLSNLDRQTDRQIEKKKRPKCRRFAKKCFAFNKKVTASLDWGNHAHYMDDAQARHVDTPNSGNTMLTKDSESPPLNTVEACMCRSCVFLQRNESLSIAQLYPS